MRWVSQEQRRSKGVPMGEGGVRRAKCRGEGSTSPLWDFGRMRVSFMEWVVWVSVSPRGLGREEQGNEMTDILFYFTLNI